MLPALIYEGRYGPVPYVLNPSTDQSKSLAAEVSDIRRETELTVKPRFDRMLIGRGHIQQVRSHERAQVAGQYFLSECIPGSRIARSERCDIQSQGCEKEQ